MNEVAVDDADEVRIWPPVHDVEDLAATIKAAAAVALDQFFTFRIRDPEANQGDVIALTSEIPIIGADGEPATDKPVDFWLVVSNTCDAARAYDTDGDVEFVPIVPLVPLSELAEDADVETALREYKMGRSFYVPAWNADIEPHVADLMKCVSLHRDALRVHATIQARMRRSSWILLNACLVRLLCRDNERIG